MARHSGKCQTIGMLSQKCRAPRLEKEPELVIEEVENIEVKEF